MATVTFREYVKGYRDITIEIPDLESFKQRVCEHIESEETLNYWDCDNELQDVCTVTVSEIEPVNEDYDEFYEKMLELKVPTNSEEVEEFLEESE